MKLTIIAATGGIGRKLLEQAVDGGHDVTAVARTPANLTRQVNTVRADLSNPDPDALASAVLGADAVLSGLGPRRISESGIVSAGTRAITAAMKAAGARRLLVVSAAPIATTPSPGRPNPPRHDPGDGFLVSYVFTPPLKAILRRPYADLALMEDVLRDSGLDWTSVRPPRLTNGPLTERYRLSYGHNAGATISRADVAHAMLRLVTDGKAIGQPVGVGY
ncbi:MAG TPA: SDR family oxidoreductase [Streptosporangiaceae bacterium]|nr:SDR family oxidoreductase [Streptosporangiaceae bacterium]